MKSRYYYYLILCITILLVNTSCEKDECDDIVCLNGGTCVNGQCDCPDGWKGPSCADQETPLRMRIHSIEVTKFPAFDNGSNWDIGDGPDIFFEILEGSVVKYTSPTFYEDADPTQDYLFDPLLIDITNTTGLHTITLYDYDDGLTADDWMGGINFVPYFSSTNGFPTEFNLDAGGAVAFRFEVSYVW